MTKPPEKLPLDLYNQYTLNGKIKIRYVYFDDTYSSNTPLIYTKEMVNNYLEEIKNRKTFYYRVLDSCLYRALEKYGIKEQSIAVIGSIKPLYESICIYYGGHPTTIEYNKIVSEDSRIKVMSVDEYDKKPVEFDAAISISTFEHSGLGRYGDPLNPQGDLEAMKKMKSLIRPSGLLFLAVPIGEDMILWNARRIYGKYRLPQLLKGWKMLDVFYKIGIGHDQPIFVLENNEPSLLEENKCTKVIYKILWYRKIAKFIMPFVKMYIFFSNLLNKFKKDYLLRKKT